MNAKVLVSCAAFFLAFKMPAAVAEQQWDCKIHYVDPGSSSSSRQGFSGKMIESTTSLDTYFDDLAGSRLRYTIVQNSPGGLIAVLPPRTRDELQLQAIILDKQNSIMKLVSTMAGGNYLDIEMGKCVRSHK